MEGILTSLCLLNSFNIVQIFIRNKLLLLFKNNIPFICRMILNFSSSIKEIPFLKNLLDKFSSTNNNSNFQTKELFLPTHNYYSIEYEHDYKEISSILITYVSSKISQQNLTSFTNLKSLTDSLFNSYF